MKQALFLVSLLLLAGCASLPGTQTDTGDVETGQPTDASPTATRSTTLETTDGGTATDTETATTAPVSPTDVMQAARTATPTPDVEPADNPWGQDTVTVALVTDDHDEIDYRTALGGAIDYWNNHTQYGDYTVEFVGIEDADESDVRVEIRDSVESCGIEHNDSVLGCAPLLTDGSRADPPATVTIEAGYNQQSTEEVMIHEFGHVLGIEHGEQPEAYMKPTNTVYQLAQPNASERGYPWQATEFTFYAATDDLRESDRDDARDQIEHVIDYYNRIKDEDPAVPSNVSVSWADNRSAANVVVEFRDQLPTGERQGSTLSQFGFDPDGDQAIEYYTNVTVALSDIDTEAIGWHTGYWYGQALGLNESALPAPFRNADARDRRDDWWTEPP